MHKLRNRKSNKRNQNIAIICIALMFITIGFALISTTLAITSNSTIGKVTFDVHFENLSVSAGSMTAKTPATIDSSDPTKINFSLNMTSPGQYYEFTSDIVNKGTLNAKVNLVTVSGLTEDQKKYIKVSYKYVPGSTIKINDLLKSGETDKVKVRVEFLEDIDAEDLPGTDENLDLTFKTEFIQDDGTGKERDKSEVEVNILGQDMIGYMDNVASKYVTSSTGIYFGSAPSNSNGKGLYLRAGTENDEVPIFYFRGEVDNNHVLFGGFCWKIVRTTEKGGTKLIYDGVPNNNQCNNTGTASQIGVSKFNNSSLSLADVGYMYGTRYEYTSWDDTAYVYGSDVTYSNGTYTLKETSSGTIANIKNKHYTCKKTTNETCNTVYYVYSYYNGKAYAIALKNGEKLENIINNSFTNENDSEIKKTVDNWFKDNLLDQKNKLEDAVWCNDRSISSGGYLDDSDLTLNSGYSYLSGYKKIYVTYKPGLKDEEACPNKNDRFTVSDTTKGNGEITYPVGLITVDEVIVANGINGFGSKSYLYTGEYYWILSPYDFWADSYRVLFFNTTGGIAYNLPQQLRGVRPTIVLKNGTVATSGKGTASEPFVIS